MNMLFCIVILVLILTAFLLRLGHNVIKTSPVIPGPQKTDPVQGNLPDLIAAGSVQDFLKRLHKTYGPMARFYIGQNQLVSIATPSLLKEQALVFDRSRVLHALFEDLWTSHSLTYVNGINGQKKHAAYSRCFTHASLQQKYHVLQKYSADVCTEWASYPKGQHIPLTDPMLTFTIKSIFTIVFGRNFTDARQASRFKEAYQIVWCELEFRALNVECDVNRKEKFEKYKAVMYEIMHESLDVANTTNLDDDTFVKVVQTINNSAEVVDADMMTICVGGFHTTGYMLIWCVYFLATNPDVQNKVYQEVTDLVGDETIPFEALGKMRYMRQVLDETLRCSVLAPFATRIQSTDTTLRGRAIPAGTTIVHALGVILEDGDLWPNPEKFDPDRFNPENRKNIPNYGFEPFGFAGKRRCPAHRLPYVEASLLLGDLVRMFKINTTGQQTAEKMYGFVTKPKDEIWISLERRT